MSCDMRKVSVILLLALVSFAGCIDEPLTAWEILNSNLKKVDQVQLQADIEAIDQYLEDNSIGNVLTESHGVRYVINGSLGSGSKPKLTSNIVFDYVGRLIVEDDDSFDDGVDVTYPLSNLIMAWQLVLPLVPAGTHVTMYIPSGLGYGPQGSGSVIPPNANLIFEVYLQEVY
jgi:FKBP-type peptidyl-prolyl cis-trans isomerase